MAGQIHYKLGLDAAPLVKGFAMARASAHSFTSGMASALSSAGKLIAGIAAPGIVGLGKSLFAAADMEAVEGQFETLLGSTSKAKKLVGEMKDFANSTPFKFPELAEAGRMLLAMGGSAESVVGELRMLGDIASGVGMPIGELAEIFGKARSQMQMTMEDINQLGGRGIPILALLARQFKTSTGEVRGLVSAGKVGFADVEKAMRGMTTEGGKFFEMTQRQAKTTIGLWSTLSDSLGELSRAFGTPFLQELKPLLDDTTKGTNGLAEAAKTVGEYMADGVGLFRQMWKQGTLGTAFESVNFFDIPKMKQDLSEIGDAAFLAMHEARRAAVSPIERESLKDVGMNGAPVGTEGSKMGRNAANSLNMVGLIMSGNTPVGERHARTTAEKSKVMAAQLTEINRKMDRDNPLNFK